jgi:hypothetical protein
MSRPPMRSARSIDGDGVAGLIELIGAGETGGTGADDGDGLSGAFGGGWGVTQPSSQPRSMIAHFDVLDRHRRLDHAEHAGALAGGGADAAGELGEVVGLVQALERFLPATAVDEVVPLRDEVVDGAAAGHAGDDVPGVAERRAAVHAARALGARCASSGGP